VDNFITSRLFFETKSDIIGLMKEQENIFSWRKALREKTPEERIQWFYDKKLIPALADDVDQAEQNRQKTAHQDVEEAFSKWTTGERDQEILRKLASRENKYGTGLSEQADLIEVGLAGLGRIEHVDANSQLKSSLDREPVMARIVRAQELYNRLGLENLAPWTIHCGSIHWLSEVAQDKVNTHKILNQPEEATEILDQAIRETSRVVDALEREELDLIISDEELKRESYNAWRKRKIYLGALSALGVLLARQGKIKKHLPWLFVGLKKVHEAHRYEPNPHRLATLAIWAFFGALNQSYLSRRPYRLKTVRSGLKYFFEATSANPKDAFLALSQHLKEGHL
jgi:hypothetical protein